MPIVSCRRIAVSLRRRAHGFGRSVRYVVGTQYLSLASAAVLVLLLYVALTNDAFQPTSDSRASAAHQDSLHGFGQSAPQAPVLQIQRPRSIVYYIVGSDAEREMVQTALISLTRGRLNGTAVPVEEVYLFVRAADAAEEAWAWEWLYHEGAAAIAQGVSFQVLDLRVAGY